MSFLIRDATVITMDPQRRILPHTDLKVRDGKIFAIGENLMAEAHEKVWEASGKVLIPGLIQSHVHLCQTLFRNQADGLVLLDWLRERIWPFESVHDADTLRASAELGLAELIRCGTTAILDMGTVQHSDVLFETAQETGFRLTGGKAHMDLGEDFPIGLQETTDASLEEGIRLCKRWHGAADGLLRYAFAPRFVLSCTDELMQEVAKQARELGARLHTHSSENEAECKAVHDRYQKSNVIALHELGLSGTDTVLAHCIWLDEVEVELLAQAGTHVCHCPSSNLKLASGFAPIPELWKRRIAVSLGADGAPCNNNLDIWTEIRLAALIHNPRCGPLAMPPERVLEMATMGGAKALGLEKQIGSIEVGKQADLVLLDCDRPEHQPNRDDWYGTLVYSGQASMVRDVWIAGRHLLRNRKLTTLEEEQVTARAAEALVRLQHRLAEV